MTNTDKSNFRTLKRFGKIIREEREKRNIFLRQIAAFLEVDTALMSKVERGERSLNREQVIKIASFYSLPEDEVISSWLSDKIIDTVGSDPYAVDGILKALDLLKIINNEDNTQN